jgi:hypothetical protein
VCTRDGVHKGRLHIGKRHRKNEGTSRMDAMVETNGLCESIIGIKV